MRFLVVMDAIERVDVDKDTTFGFLVASQARGHDAYYCAAEDLYYGPQGPSARCAALEVWQRPGEFYRAGDREDLPLSAFDSVWMRKDPPVDWVYLHATLLLDGADTLVVNHPRGLRDANEKLWGLRFAELGPETMVTNDPRRIRSWLDSRREPLVVKPIDGHGGIGVFLLTPGDRNVNSILETLTDEGRKWVVIQAYLPEARDGDKRIVLLNGEPLGAVMRVPRGDDHRGNIHVGGTVEACELTPRDLEICAAIGPSLVEDGLWFVGLDVIGDRLTEVNVTSPTGIREIKDLGGVDIGDAYVAWVEASVRARRG